MNGKAPPFNDKVLVALETYAYFLAKGGPTGVAVKGQGYPKLKAPAQPADYDRGAKVYAQHCALCHGADGAGQKSADGQTVFPPLWGPRSFNWGAGMGSIHNAAGFIKANMPLGTRRLAERSGCVGHRNLHGQSGAAAGSEVRRFGRGNPQAIPRRADIEIRPGRERRPAWREVAAVRDDQRAGLTHGGPRIKTHVFCTRRLAHTTHSHCVQPTP